MLAIDDNKDLGVYYDQLLLFDKHISEKVNIAYTTEIIMKTARATQPVERKYLPQSLYGQAFYRRSFQLRAADVLANPNLHRNTHPNFSTCSNLFSDAQSTGSSSFMKISRHLSELPVRKQTHK